jgi:hypothetical protein
MLSVKSPRADCQEHGSPIRDPRRVGSPIIALRDEVGRTYSYEIGEKISGRRSARHLGIISYPLGFAHLSFSFELLQAPPRP